MPPALIPLCHPLRTCSHASLHRYLPLHDMVTGHELKTVPPRDADVASKLPNFAETLRFSHRQKLNGHFMDFCLSWACNLDWMRRSAAADGLVDRPRFMRVCFPWPWKTSQPAMIWKVQRWQCWPQFMVYLPFALTQQWCESWPGPCWRLTVFQHIATLFTVSKVYTGPHPPNTTRKLFRSHISDSRMLHLPCIVWLVNCSILEAQRSLFVAR